VLKIDRSFVQNMAIDATQGQALIRAIVDLAQTLELETVAEGIEIAGQMARLQAIGCQAGQGFYFARPLDPSGMELVLGEAVQGGQITSSLETAS